MSRRLRLYFGSSRSNTAPELLEDLEEDTHACAHRPPAMRYQTHLRNFPAKDEDAVSDDSLKRSSSMFIPQLQFQPDARPTKSSSVQISLQRSATPQEDPTPEESPPRYVQDPAPAYTEPRNCSNVSLTDSAHPKRRVFCLRPYDLPNGRSPSSGFSIQRSSPTESSDIRQFRIVPYTPDVQNGARRWSVQPTGPRRLVLQLQQDGEGDTADHKASRIPRCPRIRLERSTSQPLLPRQVPSRPGSMPNLRTSVSEMEDDDGGCTFKIGKESNPRQPRFKIYFSQGAERRANSVVDVNSSEGSTWSYPKVTLGFFCCLNSYTWYFQPAKCIASSWNDLLGRNRSIIHHVSH